MANATRFKPRNSVATRSRILAAAREVFSQVNYSRAGLRDIAAKADVHTKMLQWHFGSKADLYEAALADALKYSQLPTLDRKEAGRFLVEGLFRFSGESSALGIISLAAGDPEASAIVLKVVNGPAGMSSLAEWMGPPDPLARAMQFTMLIHGFLTYHTNIPILQQSPEVVEVVKDWMIRTIQDIVEGKPHKA